MKTIEKEEILSFFVYKDAELFWKKTRYKTEQEAHERYLQALKDYNV